MMDGGFRPSTKKSFVVRNHFMMLSLIEEEDTGNLGVMETFTYHAAEIAISPVLENIKGKHKIK
jgi:hypothetical protein